MVSDVRVTLTHLDSVEVVEEDEDEGEGEEGEEGGTETKGAKGEVGGGEGKGGEGQGEEDPYGANLSMWLMSSEAEYTSDGTRWAKFSLMAASAAEGSRRLLEFGSPWPSSSASRAGS